MSRFATTDFVAKARTAWGEPPAWIIALAEAANRDKLKGVAARLDVSVSLVSTVIANRYGAGLDRIEQLVRGAYLGSTVSCPVLGDLARDRCLKEQVQPFRATSALRARLFHACKTCPHRKGAAS